MPWMPNITIAEDPVVDPISGVPFLARISRRSETGEKLEEDKL